jgi:hypothetical protein
LYNGDTLCLQLSRLADAADNGMVSENDDVILQLKFYDEDDLFNMVDASGCDHRPFAYRRRNQNQTSAHQ